MRNGNASRAAWCAGLTLYYRSSWLFSPMDNGEHLLTQVSPETRPTLLLTMTGPGEWAMQNGGRGTPAAPWARDASEMTN